MSKTPRTDAARGFHDLETAVSADFASQLERELEKARSDNEVLLERLAERVRDYTTHAAKELDKLRAANKGAEALADIAKQFRDELIIFSGKYRLSGHQNLWLSRAIDKIEAHEARIKSLS